MRMNWIGNLKNPIKWSCLPIFLHKYVLLCIGNFYWVPTYTYCMYIAGLVKFILIKVIFNKL